MQISKRFILSVLCFLLTLILLSALILYPVYHYELNDYRDANLRMSLVGQIDYLFLGASHGYTSYQPNTVDAELGNFSYNLSSPLMDWDSKIYMLEKELARNPVKHVAIEISYNALSRDETKEFAEGPAVTVQRLDSFGEVLQFMLKHVNVNDWLNIYSRLLAMGLSQWLDLIQGDTSQQICYENRGFHDTVTNVIRLEEISATQVHTSYLSENVQKLEQMIQMCKDMQVAYSIVVVPLSDAYLYASEGWDDFYAYMQAFCQEHNCELYDFNLLRDRYTIFSDTSSFFDIVHLSNQGAMAFSKAYAGVMKRVMNGESIDDLFYGSYQEMLLDSPYAK